MTIAEQLEKLQYATATQLQALLLRKATAEAEEAEHKAALAKVQLERGREIWALQGPKRAVS